MDLQDKIDFFITPYNSAINTKKGMEYPEEENEESEEDYKSKVKKIEKKWEK